MAVLVSALAGTGAAGAAADPVARENADAASGDLASERSAISPREAMALTHRAVRGLRQAALQREVASPAQERLLLEQIKAGLELAVPALRGERREHALRLLADLDAAMRRGSNQLGPLVSPFHDSFDPPLPGRNELALLAKEGEALLRDEPLQRPPNTDDIAWTQRGTPPATGPVQGSLDSLGARDLISPVPGQTAAWPQLQFRLGR